MVTPPPAPPRLASSHTRTHLRARIPAFTLLELLVVVAILAILASLLLPSLLASRSRAHLSTCLNHHRQLHLAWQLYTDDASGRLPSNDAAPAQGLWRSHSNAWTGPSNAVADTNAAALRAGSLVAGGYLPRPECFRCPADASRVDRSRLPRTRSYAMNGNLAGRTSEVQTVLWHEHDIPSPARLLLLIDEAPDSIDDGHFLVWPNPDPRWVNLPAHRHQGRGAWSLADGHVESPRWRHPKRFSPRQGYWKPARDPADLHDLRDLQEKILPLAPP